MPTVAGRLGLWLLLGIAASTTAADAQSAIARGKAIVEANCARCHAVGRTGESTHPEAPPFRTLSSRYPIEALEEAFAEGISTGHPDMPQFVATPEQIKAIIAYITSIQNH
ncbi:MAG: cytochrome c [Rhizobiaceae bacterium]|nr:cytochrome c [Rhizobiaceae bacterium]